jgi:FKBP-type peptidyl-prolyl cis-trans isomerase FkpA
MNKCYLPLLLVAFLGLSACGGPEPEPRAISAIPANKADIDPSGVEAVQLAEGLSSRTLLQGEGPVVDNGHTAIVHYTGWLYDENAPNFRGSKFDSSVDHGAPFPFTVGAGRVIKGWDQGVAGMRVGEVRELTIAPDMGYGERGYPPVIPPSSTLIFVVELLGIEGVEPAEETSN